MVVLLPTPPAALVTAPMQVAEALYGPGRRGVVLARRAPWEARPGLLEFPGGCLLDEERPAEAARREMREECDCLIEITCHLFTLKRPSGETDFFAGTIADGVPAPRYEHDMVACLHPDCALQMPHTDSAEAVLNHLWQMWHVGRRGSYGSCG